MIPNSKQNYKPIV